MHHIAIFENLTASIAIPLRRLRNRTNFPRILLAGGQHMGWAERGANAGRGKVALITGVTGQDGAYLAEFLLGLGYVVHGVKRRASQFNSARIDHLYQDL